MNEKTSDEVKTFHDQLRTFDKVLNNSDIEKILEYSPSLNPKAFVAFATFASEVGFPSTIGAARMGLRIDDLKTEDILSMMVKAHILDVVSIPGGTIEDFVNRDWKEDKEIKKTPEDEIKVYDYNPEFVTSLSGVVRKLELKGEEKEHGTLDLMQEHLQKIRWLLNPVVESHDDEPSEEDELGFFHHLDNDAIDKFSEGLLLVLGELEASGKIPKFENARQAKAALMATIRKLYQSRSSVGKMARKYQRFGAQRVLRKGRRDIQKAQSAR